jgi:hypothetical protein
MLRQLSLKLAALLLVLGLFMGLFLSSAQAERNLAARTPRPTRDGWSDGPTLYIKHKISTASPRKLQRIHRSSKLRLKVLDIGTKATISTAQDLRNYLGGHGSDRGAIAEMQARLAGTQTTTARKGSGRLYKVALSSRERVRGLLERHGVTKDERNLLAEMMVWRNLAYNSSTLAHGSFGPKDTGNAELQTKARDGLNAAISESFKLGSRLERSVQTRRGDFLRWHDIARLQGAAIKDFQEKEPGQVRSVNFSWPVNSFGVDWQLLHGNAGLVGKFGRHLEKQGAASQRNGRYAKNPLKLMTRTLYWLHNVHAFRDGNGRAEVLVGWSMAKAGGFPLPLHFDQAAGDFKLAATKWGGTRSDLQRFVARGAVRTEAFARKLLPLLGQSKIVSSHTDHGAVAAVTAPRKGGGSRNLVVMFPVTHAKQMDAELAAEQGKNRVVLTGERFDPGKVRIQIAVNGKHNQWKTVTPSAVNRWDKRYPWWTTVEPIYKVQLPGNANFVNFRVIDGKGNRIGPKDYYMNLQDYQNINSRI